MDNRTGESTRVFAGHIKQYFASLPLFTVVVLILSWTITLLDVPGRLNSSSVIVSHYLNLSANKVLSHWQAHRLVVYPFASLGVTYLLTNTLLVLPYLASMERKHGTVRLAWALLILMTFATSVAYVILIGVYSMVSSDMSKYYTFAGLSAWTVGLAVWSAIEEQAEGQSNDRMLFGVIRIPGHIMPHLIIAFYFFLMPDLSLIIHLITAGIAYGYAKNKLPPRLVPSEDTYRNYEQNPWLGRAVNHGRFISVDNTSAYLPIANSSSQHLNADTTTTTAPSSSYTPFSGQGQRLGDA
ncbi:predicted protein [Lichtheimia corymbifera JMRC:FSU:9682]|uniref:Peptidase S54 rhomboid domain-containing protein n=1 Tax=Lichtheimia corymbifera JMRC:FSU:9682 TaxID=1263082 RepID=A0A068S3F1_9FUNG|nr:predicted protein [Lichtheimia corymbifera JMRC:FSU:9682]